MGRYYNDFNDIRGSDDSLIHYGIKGMKWGIRRYVNYDGTLTAEGLRRYGTYENFQRSPEGRRILAHPSTPRPTTPTTPRYTKIQNGVQTNRQSSLQPLRQQIEGMTTRQKLAVGAATTAAAVGTAGAVLHKLPPKQKVIAGSAMAASALAATGTAVMIRNHHNMMEYESAIGNKAMQNMSAKWRSMSVGAKAKAIVTNAKTSWHDRDGVVLDEGTNFHRMEVGSHAVDPKKVNRGLYVTYKPSDYVKYKSDFVTDRLNRARKEAKEALKNGDMEKYNDIMGNTKATERIMSSNKKVVIPSNYDSKKVFYEEIYGKNKATVSDLLKKEFDTSSNEGYNPRSHSAKVNDRVYAEAKRLMSKDNLNDKEQQRLYDLYNKALGVGVVDTTAPSKNGKLLENKGVVDYYSALEKRGFGALKDVNDRKLGYYNSEAPLIILDRNHTMQDVGKDVVRNIGWDEYKNARVKARVGPDAVNKAINEVSRILTGKTGNSEGFINFGHDSKQNKADEDLYNQTSRQEAKFSKRLTIQQHLKAEGLSKQLGTSTISVLSSISRRMSEDHMSFDQALNAYKENAKAKDLSKQLGTSTNSILSSINRKMSEENMSFDEALESYKENVKKRGKEYG